MSRPQAASELALWAAGAVDEDAPEAKGSGNFELGLESQALMPKT